MHCLVIDDSDVVRKIAAHFLSEFQAEVVEAGDSATALAACAEAMPDLVLLDWHLPAATGFDVLVALRRMPGGDRPYVIYVTSENDARDIARALTAGANDYLLKPFDRESFLAKIEMALEPA
jgi:two-component system, chemotaxis family, chemotaxis protein CheY